MKLRWTMTWIAVSLLGALAMLQVAYAQSSAQAKAEVALRAAMETETVKGDLKGAIERYKKLAQGSNRAIAAQALLHMGDCYEKLGSNEADKQYALVISKFADQKDAVAQARAHLGGAAAKTNGMVNRPVWSTNLDVMAVSPDGRYFSFNDWKGNAGSLVLHDLSTGTDRPLTNAAKDKDEGPDESSFSPDGKQIAYIWDTKQGSDLRILGLPGTGQATPRIFKNADWNYDRVAWSPDGKSLAVLAGQKGKPWQLILVSVQDGSFRALTSQASYWNLFFSPDGKYLAYDRDTNGGGSQKDIFVVAIDSGREIPAVVYPSDDSVMGWSKDGRLLFASDRNGSKGLWSQAFSDGKPQGQPTLLKADIGNGSAVGMTSSGSLYYFVEARPQLYLEIAPFDFTASKILSTPVAAGQPAQTLVSLEQYNWSPDGKYLAFVTPSSGIGDRSPAIVIRSTDTGQSRVLLPGSISLNTHVLWAPDNRTLLVTGPGQVHLIDTQTDRVSTFHADAALGPQTPEVFAWSPDQKKIYFRRGTKDSVAFFESDPDLKNAREIIRRSYLGGLNLTPDGRTIITGDRAALMAIPVAGGEPKVLLSRNDAGNIFISPDGRFVALAPAFPAAGRGSAVLIPVEGGEARELLATTPALAVSMGMWAPDSRSIFLKKSTPDNQQIEVWRVPVDGGQTVKVETGLNLDQITRYFGVSPTGNQIAFIRGTKASPKSEIWVLENFLSSIPVGK